MALFTVQVSNEGTVLGEHGFSQDVVTIGRDANSELHVDFEFVSRRHAQLRLTDSGFTVTALSSTNTTDLNGAPLELDQSVELENGDLVLLSGAVLLRVTWDVEDEGEATVESGDRVEPAAQSKSEALPMVPAAELEEAKWALATQERRNRKIRADMSLALQAVAKAESQLVDAEGVAKRLLASLEASRQALGDLQAGLRARTRVRRGPPPSGKLRFR